MSYLLDALNKSRGNDGQAPMQYDNQPPQAAMYNHGHFPAQNGTNIYKWISIVLALILTLLVGIYLGTRFDLFGGRSSNQAQTVAAQPQRPLPQPVDSKPAPLPATAASSQQVTASTKKPSTPAPQQAVETKQSNAAIQAQPEAADSATIDAASSAQQTPGEQQLVISHEKPHQDGVSPVEAKDLNVSNELLQRFNQAVKQSADTDSNYLRDQKAEEAMEEYLTKVPALSELDHADQARVPGFVYETHLYSTAPKKRRVKLNGTTFKEKDWISNDIQIYQIQKQFLILQMGHLRFSVPALTDWQEITD